MLLEITKFQNLSVGSFDEGIMIGKISKPIVNPSEKKLIGFIIKPKGFFASEKVVSFEDVIDIDQAGVVLRSADSLVNTDEVVRISQLIKSNFKLIGLSAFSKEMKFIGKVYDALIDSTTGAITRIYVRHLFADYVFDQTQIEEITQKMVKLRTEKRQRAKKHAESLASAKTA